MKLKIWVDDVRKPPAGYVWCQSVNGAKECIAFHEFAGATIELLDMDHDAGDFYNQGGDFIEILNWLEQTGRNYPIRVHSMNPVGVENMRRIIQRNNWAEVM